jgi:HAD superfamily hydrolase (TIGR01450 family)
MKSIILAAGMGSRLRPMTDSKPKTLVTVSNKPMINHIIDSLVESSVDEIVICVGYESEQLISHVNKCYQGVVTISYVHNSDFQTTNNMYSLYLAKKYLCGDIILMNADLVFDAEIIKKISKIEGSMIAVDRGNYLTESMKLIVQDDKVRSISKTISEEESYGSSIDVYKIDSKACGVIVNKITEIIEVEKDYSQWTEVLLDRVMSENLVKFKPFDIDSRKWFEIDDYNDLNNAEILFNNYIDQLKHKKLFVLDKDGTISIGHKAVPGAEKFIKTLDKKNIDWVIGTNNSSKTNQQHCDSILALLSHKTSIEIVSSLDVSISYFKQNRIKKIFWMASEEVGNKLQENFEFDDISPEAVLLTYDTNLTYTKILKIISLINSGVPYYATHIDNLCPSENGNIPDIGLFIDLIYGSSNIYPVKTFGKPSTEFLNHISDKFKVELSDIVFIGDRLYTDIAISQNNDVISILVLTGETTRSDYERSNIKANIVIDSLDSLSCYL